MKRKEKWLTKYIKHNALIKNVFLKEIRSDQIENIHRKKKTSSKQTIVVTMKRRIHWL